MRAPSYSAQFVTRHFVLYFGCTREFIPGVWRPTRARPRERPGGGSGPCTNAIE
jgi:hypothetical protein